MNGNVVPVLSEHSLNTSTTLIDLLNSRSADHSPTDYGGFIFLKDGEADEQYLNFASLYRRAELLAHGLYHAFSAGSRVLLGFAPGLDFIVALLGCLQAGLVAVPVVLPWRTQPYDSFLAIAENCTASAVLTDRASANGISADLAAALRTRKLPLLPLDELEAVEPAVEFVAPTCSPRNVALLQYTSGSTGRPRGVVITHANLMANLQMIARGFGNGSDTVGVSWLPINHDMGLVGNILQPLYLGIRCVLMAPAAFLQRPVRWLEAISRYRATVSGGPNFAYDLCTQRVKPEQIRGLDLNCWKVAYTGAEPVRVRTMRRFAETFASAGFSPRSFYPCYGLAEATLFVSGGAPAEARNIRYRGQPSSQTIVSCGTGHGSQRLLIVDAETRRLCARGVVGEIWIQGPHVAAGYWNDPAAHEQTFEARLDGFPEQGRFLRTGDLGLLDERGHLFVTGRCKELIIIRGRKLHPHDVEDILRSCHEVLSGARGAAFAVECDGHERLVAMFEQRRQPIDPETHQNIAIAAREAVAHRLHAQLHDLVLVEPGRLPHTSSGKPRRYLCRDLYRQRLAGAAAVPPDAAYPDAR